MTGQYITFEGTVGTGKSTQAELLYNYLKEKYPKKEIILTREPGGSEIAESIRQVAQGNQFNEDMQPICEAYLYAASRAQTLLSIVKPAIQRGAIVISDRSHISSLAYQGNGRNLGIDTITQINKIAVCIRPHKIFFINLDPEIGLARSFDKVGDKFENLDIEFFKKVYSGYQTISQMPDFKDSWINVDGRETKEDVFKRIISSLHF